MARKSPSAKTLKLLYVKSGNKCAFPDCDHPIFNDEGMYIAQLCHIKAAKKGGQRYDKDQTEEERSAPENLLFMCYRHHKETDDIEKYTVEKLIEIKTNHELKYTEKGREASKEMIRQILYDISYFWNKQSIKSFDLVDLKIEREFNKEALDLFSELNEHIDAIQNYCDLCAESDSAEVIRSDLKQIMNTIGIDISIFDSIPYYENPFANRNWEMHNIGRPNIFSHIALCISQLKVKFVEELLKGNPNDIKLITVLEEARKEFEMKYDNSYYVD